MRVHVSSKDKILIDWTEQLNDGTGIDAIARMVCKVYALPLELVHLHHKGLQVTNKLLKQLQPNGSGVLQLALTVDLTLANYIWQSLVVAGGSSVLDIAAYWHAVAEVLALNSNWSTLRLAGQSSRLRFVALDHADAISEDLAMANPDMGSPGWCSVPAATRTMLLMVSTVMRLRFMLQSSLSTEACTRLAAGDLGQKLDQIRRRQTSVQSGHSATAPCDAQHAALRRALLLVKAASLVTSLSVHEASIPLWSAATKAFEQVRDYSSPPARDSTESQSLTVLVVQLVIPALRKFVTAKTDNASTAALCCCLILNCLMPTAWPVLHEVAAKEIISSGMLVLVAALGLKRKVTARAVDVIHLALTCPDLPRELVDSAEEALLRYQAVPRLCKILQPKLPALPGVDPDSKEGARLQKAKFWGDAGEAQQIPFLARLAALINRLLKRSPPPTDPDQALPTPTSAFWDNVHDNVDMLLKVRDLCNHVEYTPHKSMTHDTDPVVQSLRDLRKDLSELPYNLVAGYLPDLSLDVTKLMQCTVRTVLSSDPVEVAGTPFQSLLLAYLRRLARQPSLLELPETPGSSLRHKPKGKACPGCPDCNGAEWDQKTCIVACLWANFCYGAGSAATQTIAAAAIEALHTALVSSEQCKHLLLHTQHLADPEAHSLMHSRIQAGFDLAIRSLQGHLTAQLTAGACLARLCAEEKTRASSGKITATPWLEQALNKGTFQLVYDCLQKAVQAPLPWAVEQCVAMARCMYRMGQLQDMLADQSYFLQLEGQAVQVVVKLLPQLADATSNESLQQEVLYAAVCFINMACGRRCTELHDNSDDLFKELGIVLTNALFLPCLDLTANARHEQAELPGFSRVGLKVQHIQAVHSVLLYMAVDITKRHGAFDWFLPRVMPYCLDWFSEHVHWGLKTGSVADIGILTYLAIFDMLSAHTPNEYVPQADAARLALFALSMLVQTLAALQMQLAQAKQSLTINQSSSQRQAAKDKVATLERKADAARESVEQALGPCEHIRVDHRWASAFIAVDESGWAGSKEEAERFRQELALWGKGCPKLLPTLFVRRLQTCFWSSVARAEQGLDEAEASAAAAFEQLWSEEQQAADRAAAKKAKKLKQKAKKQQAQSSATPTADTEYHLQACQTACDTSPTGQTHSVGSNEPSGYSNERLPVARQLFKDSTSQEAAGPAECCTHHQSALELPSEVPHSTLQPSPSSTVQPVERTMVSQQAAEADADSLHSLLCCPITKILLVEPMIAADGHTYEKAAILAWLQHSSVSPVTGTILAHTRIVPNVLIRSVIATNQGL